jgi:hypothetical protein
VIDPGFRIDALARNVDPALLHKVGRRRTPLERFKSSFTIVCSKACSNEQWKLCRSMSHDKIWSNPIRCRLLLAT